MRKILRIIFRTLLIIIVLLLIACGSALYYFIKNDYKPAVSEELAVIKGNTLNIAGKNEFSFISWNIGYCGLDKKMDFFYDGGKKVRTPDSVFQENLNGVFSLLSDYDSVDFFMLQEVDTCSKRSYFTNQMHILREALPYHEVVYAANYQVSFVPVPLLNPMGGVNSGLLTFSSYKAESYTRYAYPVNYPFPMNLFMLDRCFILMKVPLANGKHLVVINLHNSAFGDADMLRQYELWMLRGFLLREYAAGNYVVAGGDWNQNPPGYEKGYYYSGFFKNFSTPLIPADYMPEGWTWCYDPLCPTNRDVYEAYREGFTPTTTYDFFLCSPNLVIEQVAAIDCGFTYSDHQPVYMRISLNDDPMASCSNDCLDEIVLLRDSLNQIRKKGK